MLIYRLSSVALMLASMLYAQQQPPREEPLYSFGTTVFANTGFRGEIYYIEQGAAKLPNFSKLKSVGAIYTPALNVPLRDFSEGFPGITDRFEWFAIDYSGRFWVSTPGEYRFALASDDGSDLYIDGKRVINNDKQHPILEKTHSVKLKSGVHSIRVSYFQGPRSHVALVLRVAFPGGEYKIFHADDFKPPVGER